MVEIEKFSCQDGNEARARERYWFETLQSSLNSYIPNRTAKEWYVEKYKEYAEQNKEKIKEQMKEYREQHKEQIKEQMKEYREQTKEQKREYNKAYYLRKKAEKII
jgi:esterase/lipase